MKRFIFTLILLITISSGSFSQSYTRDLKLSKSRMNGNDVVQLQKMLRVLGYDEVGEADGWLGPKTETAIKEFQSVTGFDVNGIFGKKEFDFMFSGSYLNLQLKNAIKEMNNINSKNLSKSEDDYEKLRSTEGASIITYRWDRKNVKAEIAVFGESGQGHYEMYPLIDEDFLLIETSMYYSDYMGFGGNATVSVTPYLYCDGKFYRIDGGKFISESINTVGTSIIEDLKNILW